MTLNIAGSTLNSHSLICPSIKVGRHTTRQSIPSWDVGFSVVNSHRPLLSSSPPRSGSAVVFIVRRGRHAISSISGGLAAAAAAEGRPCSRSSSSRTAPPHTNRSTLQNVTVVSQLSFSWGSLIDGDGDTRTDKGGCSLCWRSCGAAAPPPLIHTRSSTPPTSYSPAPPH